MLEDGQLWQLPDQTYLFVWYTLNDRVFLLRFEDISTYVYITLTKCFPNAICLTSAEVIFIDPDFRQKYPDAKLLDADQLFADTPCT